jgi:hypothetical protein
MCRSICFVERTPTDDTTFLFEVLNYLMFRALRLIQFFRHTRHRRLASGFPSPLPASPLSHPPLPASPALPLQMSDAEVEAFFHDIQIRARQQQRRRWMWRLLFLSPLAAFALWLTTSTREQRALVMMDVLQRTTDAEQAHRLAVWACSLPPTTVCCCSCFI